MQFKVCALKPDGLTPTTLRATAPNAEALRAELLRQGYTVLTITPISPAGELLQTTAPSGSRSTATSPVSVSTSASAPSSRPGGAVTPSATATSRDQSILGTAKRVVKWTAVTVVILFLGLCTVGTLAGRQIQARSEGQRQAGFAPSPPMGASAPAYPQRLQVDDRTQVAAEIDAMESQWRTQEQQREWQRAIENARSQERFRQQMEQQNVQPRWRLGQPVAQPQPSVMARPQKPMEVTCTSCRGSGHSRFVCSFCGGLGLSRTTGMACGLCNGSRFTSCGICGGKGTRREF